MIVPEGRQAGHRLDVVARLDGVVQVLEQEDEAEREEQPDQRGEEGVEQDAGRGRVRPAAEAGSDDREQVRPAVRREAEHRGVRLAEGDDPALERLQLLLVDRPSATGGSVSRWISAWVSWIWVCIAARSLVDELLDLGVPPGDRRRGGDHLVRQRVREGRRLLRVAVLDGQVDEGRVARRVGDDPLREVLRRDRRGRSSR